MVVQNRPTSGDPRGFEGDSNGDFPDSVPGSDPIIANYTLVSEGNGDNGMEIRRGSGGIYANGIVSGFGGNGVDFDADGAATPTFASLYVAGSGGDATDSEAAPFFDADTNNVRGAATLPSIFSISETRAVVPANLADDDDFDQDGDFEDEVDPEGDMSNEGDDNGDGRADDDQYDRFPVDGIEETLYIGAFADSIQSVEDSWLDGWALNIPAFDGVVTSDECPAGTFVSQNTAVPAGRSESNVCTLPNLVEGDLFLPAGNLYELDGTTFVGEDAGGDPANPIAGAVTGRLTVGAGVTIFGVNGPDALVVSRGSELLVNGTASNPVIMTSQADVQGGAVQSGQWGGLVINGRAPINSCEDGVLGTVACEKEGEGGSGFFGGQTADDDSGQISYLRVSYAGFLFGSDDELNGIAFQGVGSGTQVSYVQVHDNKDDGIEFFGGTVSVDHASVTSAGDDAFDWTDGWQGNAQYVILVHEVGESGDPRVIEADNNGGFPNREPRSNPTIANLTLIDRSGSADPEDGVKIRRGTDASFYNAIIAGDNNGDGIDYDLTRNGVDSTVDPVFFSSYVVDFATPLALDGRPDIFSTANGNRDGDANSEDSTLSVATDAAEALVPGANETSNITPATLPAGLDAAGSSFIGAVEDADDTWYLGWTVAL